jgi:hypothetical protein
MRKREHKIAHSLRAIVGRLHINDNRSQEANDYNQNSHSNESPKEFAYDNFKS